MQQDYFIPQNYNHYKIILNHLYTFSFHNNITICWNYYLSKIFFIQINAAVMCAMQKVGSFAKIWWWLIKTTYWSFVSRPQVGGQGHIKVKVSSTTIIKWLVPAALGSPVGKVLYTCNSQKLMEFSLWKCLPNLPGWQCSGNIFFLICDYYVNWERSMA